MILAKTGFAAMPFLMAVDGAKMRDFVKPGTPLEISATLEHEGSGYAVTKARITSAGKKVADSQLKFRTVRSIRFRLLVLSATEPKKWGF
jgi:3-hydroxyacyl-[acyl-carrier-protein] dehydratase